MAYTASELQALGLNENLPAHVAIIMDGNGRWAQQRGLPRAAGHRAGMDRLRGVITASSDLGIAALSLYAFSTENWKRPAEEIGALCSLLVEYFKKEIDALHKNRVCIRALGELAPFPEAVRNAVTEAAEKTRNNTGLKLNIALNYGARDELLRACKSIAKAVESGGVAAGGIDAGTFENALDTRGLPPVDLLIRTGGDQRLSNFLLYQAAYAELMFVADYFPDFSDERYLGALREFSHRTRRFGGL
ncbi:MAG TPA: polyprenyl diphosphate synthase [Feifaniaceae bacterium]|nr:polyprenyl diphosphate synthase [Feifaniaceae bacterium]